MTVPTVSAAGLADVPPSPVLRLGGRVLVPTPVFDTYWRFAAARQDVYFARLTGANRPWTTDPVIARHRFTNAYRAADRVSQFLIRDVIYSGPQSHCDVVFRVLLFKFFNRIDTWRALTERVGEVAWRDYSFQAYDEVLTGLRSRGDRIYSAAYVMPPPRLGEDAKHRNHLRLLELMMRDHLPDRVGESPTMAGVYEVLRSYPSLGPFLAYQFTIDLGYCPLVDWAESEFVVPGPGARDGIRKCFGSSAAGLEAEIIRWMVDRQADEFERLGLHFKTLWGRPLQLIDAQNLFCEVDKYARVVHPDIAGISGRQRIKQQYRPDAAALHPWFPPKWGINDKIVDPTHDDTASPMDCYRQLSLV